MVDLTGTIVLWAIPVLAAVMILIEENNRPAKKQK